jgi:hypothetical protein
MTDTNHHVLTGKVDITSNLLVGSSHLFVDTNNNRVGLVTANPDAGLHVNSNAYVNTDLRVGSQIEINATAGRVKAASFEGDGSLLENIPAGADGAAATIGTPTITTGLAGTEASVTNSGTSSAAVFDFVIPRGDAGTNGTNGTNGNDGEDGAAATIEDPTITTGLAGTEASVTNSGTSSAAVFDFVIPRGDPGTPGTNGTNYFTLSGSDIYRNTGNVGIGTTSPNNSLHIYKAAAEGTSGLFIEKASGGAETTAALFFGVNAPGENPGVAKAAIFYERNLVNGRGDLKFCNDASSDANAVTTEAVDTRMIIKNNGDVGIGTVSPDKKLHVYGSIQCHNTGTTGDENGLFLQSVGDWYNLSPGNDGYLHLLGGASGQGNMSGNFSSMKLAKLITYSDLDVNGDVNISSGNKVRINGDDAVFPRITLVNGTSYSLTSGSWTKLCDFGHNYLDGAYFIKIEWNYGGTGHYWAGMATGMVPAKSYTHVQYNHAPDEPLSLNHFYHHRTVGRFEFTLDSDNYWGASYGRIALWVKGGSTATHQFYVDVRKIL